MAKGDGGDGGDGGNGGGGKGGEGNNGGTGGEGKGGGQDSGLGGNDGFGSGGDNDNGGGSDGTGGNDGRGADSDTGAGRRGDATSAFGGEDEGSIAGKVGSANTTQAGKSPSSDMGYGLQDAVQSQKTEYGGVLAGANTGFEGYGIGDTPPGLDQTSTVQARSRGGMLSGGFDKGYGLENAVSEIGNKSKRGGFAGQSAYEGSLSKGSALAADVAQMKSIPMVGPTIGMIGDLYSKSMNPVEQRAYQDVKSHGLNSGLSTGLGIAAEYAGIPSQIATPAINAASAAMQTSYAQNAYGYSVQQGRRSNAISAFGNEMSKSSTGSSITTTPSNTWWWQPASYGVGDYGRHRSKLGY